MLMASMAYKSPVCLLTPKIEVCYFSIRFTTLMITYALFT